MCKTGKKLKFCTCLNKEDIDKIPEKIDQFLKESLANSKQPFAWTLYAHIGSESSEIMGLVNLPSESIGGILTNESVLSQINSGNCFDFDYEPLEEDNLRVHFQRNKNWIEYLSFIYRDKSWVADSHYAFTEKLEAINYGKLHVLK